MKQPSTAVILASASPRRRELLSRLGVPFSVMVSGVDEDVEDESRPGEMVIHLAERKARSVADTLTEGLVIGAGTTVVIDSQVLNKPIDTTDARRMLVRLRGGAHEVWTGVVVIDAATSRAASGAVCSLVQMRGCTDAEFDAYVATGEPLDKAGAYAIQGGAGIFVERIDGCYTNVVGLPLCELSQLLAEFGIVGLTEAFSCTLADGSICPRAIEFRQRQRRLGVQTRRRHDRTARSTISREP